MAIMAELQENLTNMAIFETAASLNELNDSSIRKPYRLKRIFDAVFSLFMIILLSPLYLLIACVIKLTSLNEPVIFKQRRIGYKGKEFICYKFRTMVPDAEKHLEIILEKKPKLKEQFNKEFKLKKDSRIIPLIGDFLRKTSLDELPQFFNVLKGDMSVVGPRPVVMKEITKYGEHIISLISVMPGITGLWQVSGRNNISYEQRVLLDDFYAKNNSFLMDLKIIFKTIFVMVNKSGAY